MRFVRWATGTPGGIGGEFAPKDSGDATNALHDAISSDAASNAAAPLDPDSAWAALTSAIGKPSQLGEGAEAAGPARDALTEEMLNEIQTKTNETHNEQQLNDAAAAKEIETGQEAPGVTTAAEAIANAINAGPYMTPNGTLLNAQNAVINPDKIIGYALNPASEKGADKAVVFDSALGYNQSNADTLIQQLQEGVAEYPAEAHETNQFGTRFTVNIPVIGPNGNTATVLTGWIYDPGSDTPRLITARIKK